MQLVVVLVVVVVCVCLVFETWSDLIVQNDPELTMQPKLVILHLKSKRTVGDLAQW